MSIADFALEQLFYKLEREPIRISVKPVDIDIDSKWRLTLTIDKSGDVVVKCINKRRSK